MKKEITVSQHLIQNCPTYLLLILTIVLISYPNIPLGILTFFIMFFYSYYLHYQSHFDRNIFTILHHYHHEQTNHFSYWSQIILEFSSAAILLPLKYMFSTVFLDVWIVFFFIAFYSSIHNINYGYFRVNQVHYKHHENIYTNIGPDLCDVFFGTKNQTDECVENISHYIPNMIAIAGLVLLLKYWFQKNTKVEWFLTKGTTLFLIGAFIFYVISSIYLINTYHFSDTNESNIH
jgi:hypothetical protein